MHLALALIFRRLNNMQDFLKKIIIYSTVVLVSCALGGVVNAQTSTPPTPNKNLNTTVDLINPIGGTDANPTGNTDIKLILGGVMKKMLGILGSAALLVFVYGGFLWVTAAGNSDKVTQGTEAMEWAVIGICIIFSSYAILDLVFQGLGVTVNKQGSYEQKPGQVWCRDTNTNLCLATAPSQCAGETFEKLADCEGNNVAYEGVWCWNVKEKKCEEKLKTDCSSSVFKSTLDECEALGNQTDNKWTKWAQ
jgi:hypothetical protein